MSSADRVADAIKRHFEETGLEVVLFAGAGVAMKANLPDWRGLLQGLAEHVRAAAPLEAQLMAESIAQGKLTKAADVWALVDGMPRGQRVNQLRVILEAYDARALKHLASLPFGCCLTTNFDRALLDAFCVGRGTAPRDYKLGDASFTQAVWEKHFHVSRIHGCVEDPERIVLSDRQFDELLQTPAYVELLTRAFTDRAVLFLGFSFYDPAIRHVLNLIDKRHGAATPGRHLAIVPKGGNEFLQKAARLNIGVLEYEVENKHAALWDGIESVAKSIKKKVFSAPPPQVRTGPLTATKHYLAACYARAQVATEDTPLSEVVLEGIISGMLQQVSPKTLGAHEVEEGIRRSVGLRGTEIEVAINRSLRSLIEARLVRRQRPPSEAKGYRYAWVGQVPPESTLSFAIGKLTDAILERAYVQEGWRPQDKAVADITNDFLENLVLHRGWDLGASFASNRPPEGVDIQRLLMELCGTRLSALDRERLGRTLDSLLMRPTPAEAELLAELGRVSFALELAFQAPQSTLFHQSTLPRRVYFDANVLMPAITDGHPNQRLYMHAISRLQEAAAKAGNPCQLVVFSGYVNEIVSHRRAALDAANRAGVDFAAIARSDAVFHGPAKVNVFSGAYAMSLEQGGETDFDQFLERAAPYETEAELRRLLTKRGFIVVESLKDTIYADLNGLLEQANASKLANGKETILIEHDALQLRLLEIDREKGHRSVFVTSDRGLYDDLAPRAYTHLREMMISHIGLMQLIDLLVGLKADKRQVGALIWSSSVSEKAQRVRSYLVAEALKEYDAALAMGMQKVVEAHADRIAREIDRQGIDLDAHDPRKRANAFKVLGSLESDFFAGMKEAMEKIEARMK
ncbi:SIR2 family protein [Ramlibacter sp.]|uniref:SIR2 family NAD-dependent protein deacylase n=1 Tax=Ramlibacter sp. TaxID=1917967 RepID=UPI002CC04C7C|nr:SIR2 family protein [Ramlibacter sp.]HWI84067.1 SIR2 family protein [Ramlibacter sp.]